ncbi:hypothetical protein [Burkholderia cenocepacia]|uniref:hypothetical protein n=1 Tax=Burkholderia cenocepacia TaxID=95486 RepID=UPI0019D1F217|nr:hypothetical protein [Burkholderia cenocepacia]
MTHRHAALGIREDTDIAARCKLRQQPAAPLRIDHYGPTGRAQRHATPGRIAGVAPIFAGMIVVQWQTPAPVTGNAGAAQPEPRR